MFRLLKWGGIGFISLIVVLSIADGIRNLSETDAETFERHLKANHLDSAEDILSDNPNLEINGKKASVMLAKYKAEIKAKVNNKRLAKEKEKADKIAKENEKAERIAKEKAEKLALAKSKGYDSYDSYEAYEIGEVDKIAKEKEIKEKAKQLAKEREKSNEELKQLLKIDSITIQSVGNSVNKKFKELSVNAKLSNNFCTFNTYMTDSSTHLSKFLTWDISSYKENSSFSGERQKFILKCDKKFAFDDYGNCTKKGKNGFLDTTEINFYAKHPTESYDDKYAIINGLKYLIGECKKQ